MNPNERLRRQLEFLIEIDKTKAILRRTRVLDGSRYENDAEHSWHFAMLALVLAEYAAEPIDLFRVVKMALIHDIVEIDAGDTFAYDETARQTQYEREQRAADRIFALLPPDQAQELRSLWEEFVDQRTPDARFAHALDRLAGVLANYCTEGGGWREHEVPKAKVLERNCVIGEGAPALWELARQMIEQTYAQMERSDTSTEPT
ncbi:MAG: HD domain-containing protein [Fimbriimonadales bacterium]